MIKPGQWIQPRHGSHEAFEKDYPRIEATGVSVLCPGCRDAVHLTRRTQSAKIGGWCKRCNRGVGT
ncbi:MAG TPA: hypothetical protein DCZ01_13350 [Elusimicrobia bacterium]|nr:MAG: hypothetical protein A2X37_11890 [Elusimicrobia bacterium GWA2_66_18]OGR70685.1 MAG: hypothetical protein A2X40_06150 [Elusimicrobia bacterium GWC2_65_9]HAZ09469.1 hypothetical protein [Elusimicrobiota bacterium]